jgi:hypothetical protein
MMIDVDWRQPFIDYLSEQKVPSNKNLAEQLIRRAKSYILIETSSTGGAHLPKYS